MHIAHLLETHGYLVIFLVLFVESLGLPSPSEITLVAAGALAAAGRLDFALVVATGAMGSLCGAQVAYWIGRQGGRALILHHGGRVGLTDARLRRVEDFFRRYGILAIIFGRVLSGVRALISYPAGIFGMPWLTFTVATSLGAVLWPLLAGGLGQIMGREWHRVVPFLHLLLRPWSLALLLALLLAAAWAFLRHRRQGTGSPNA